MIVVHLSWTLLCLFMMRHATSSRKSILGPMGEFRLPGQIPSTLVDTFALSNDGAEFVEGQGHSGCQVKIPSTHEHSRRCMCIMCWWCRIRGGPSANGRIQAVRSKSPALWAMHVPDVLAGAGVEERWDGEDQWADAGSQVSFPSSRPAETTASGILEDMSFDSGLQVCQPSSICKPPRSRFVPLVQYSDSRGAVFEFVSSFDTVTNLEWTGWRVCARLCMHTSSPAESTVPGILKDIPFDSGLQVCPFYNTIHRSRPV